MEKRIVVDPVTRIEGHLRMEAIVDGGVITDAFSSGTMVRGIEIIVKDRDPRDVWAFVMRVCGVCTSMHGLASVRAVENALGISIPFNAEMVRNIMLGALYCQDHIVHFYQLQALDWVDVVAALKANPADASAVAQSISPLVEGFEPWGKNSPGYFADVQIRLKRFLEVSPDNNFLAPKKWCWGSKLYKIPPEVCLVALAHYLEALDFQKEIVKVQTVFGGKNPHPNFLVGGMACAINMQGPNAINMERLALVAKILNQCQDFINRVYLPDVIAIMAFYPEWTAIGGGLNNYLSYGDFPSSAFSDVDSFMCKRGIILNRDLSKVVPFDPDDLNGLQEFINNSWYRYSVGKDIGLHPSIGETILDYTGPSHKYDWLGGDEPYSWIKTPRYNGLPMEVGPLARFFVNYAAGDVPTMSLGDASIARLAELTLKFNNSSVIINLDSMHSTAGRTIARAIDAALAADFAINSFNMLIDNIKSGDERMFNDSLWLPVSWPSACNGYSLNEAPRGALAHYVNIADRKVDNYQLVVPTTWNASPRDTHGVRSPFEASVIGTPMPDLPPSDSQLALQVIRTIHSFDPCMSCSVHLFDDHRLPLSSVPII